MDVGEIGAYQEPRELPAEIEDVLAIYRRVKEECKNVDSQIFVLVFQAAIKTYYEVKVRSASPN